MANSYIVSKLFDKLYILILTVRRYIHLLLIVLYEDWGEIIDSYNKMTKYSLSIHRFYNSILFSKIVYLYLFV